MFFRKIASLVVMTASVILLFTGCNNYALPAVFDYVSYDAGFTVVFPSETGSVECAAERTDSTITLTVTAPERSAGTVITCSPTGCTLIPKGSGKIPLSESAGERLTAIFDLIYRGDSDSASIRKTEDGTGTVVQYTDGEIVIGDGMCPTEVTVYGENGRNVKIREYKILTAKQ